jgi:hypothetical protein
MQSDTRMLMRWYWAWSLALGMALYAVNVPGTFIYDDAWVAQEDPRLARPRGWREYLTRDYMDGAADNLWRPLTSLSYWAERRVHGDRAWPFHVINMLLHGVVSGLVAALGRRVTGSIAVGVIGGLLFAAHPIHVDAVTMIVGRAEELCALGTLAALLLVIGRPMTVWRAVGVTGWFLFASFSKEQGLLVPAMLLGWAIVRRWKAGSVAASAQQRRAGLVLVALLTGTMAAYIAYRNHIAEWYWSRGFLDWTINPVVRSAGPDRWLLPVAILGRYAALLVAPWRLSLDYSATVFTTRQALADPYLWVGIVALLAFTAGLTIAWRRKSVAVVCCLGCLAISYFLASNVITIGTVFGERLMYLPSVFLCILAAIGLARLRPAARWVAVAIIVAAFCVRTETYARRWNDREAFYAYSVRVQPKSSQLHVLLGDELERRGDLDGAYREYAAAREASPESWRPWYMSARLDEKLERYAEGAQFARQALRLSRAGFAADLYGRLAERASSQPTTAATRVK